ncbi:hypothetical protein [Gilliamella sp. App6-5]|nr:hypothetical protein [Gilliamella apicola]
MAYALSLLPSMNEAKFKPDMIEVVLAHNNKNKVRLAYNAQLI